MKRLLQVSIILVISAVLLGIGATAYAYDDVFGIKIEQRALDLLMLMSQKMAAVSEASELEQVISMKAKIIFADLSQADQTMGPFPAEIVQLIPEMIIQTRIEILRSSPDQVRISMVSDLGDVQFVATESKSIAALPTFGVFTEMDVPQILPDNLIFQDDGGLFTLINLMGGIPFGSLLRQTSGIGSGTSIGFDDVEQSDLRAVIRYWGKDKVDAGVVHVVNILTAGAAPHHQSIKIWVLEDTLELYQFSIEDARGTQIFIVIDELNTNPGLSEADFTLDTSSLAAVSEEEFLQILTLNLLASPAVDVPIAVDMSASSHQVPRTGSLTMSANGFDMQDMENELAFEIEYESPGGTWQALEMIEYAGMVPLGHWNATFAPDETAELGMYSFRSRYVDSSGNASEWLEALDMVEVTPAPPRVVRTSPLNGDTDIPISAAISVTFSKPMDSDSVEGNFSVTSGFNKSVQGVFTWDGDTLVFSPSDDLRYDATYLVMIAGEAKDVDGIGLDGNFDTKSDGIPYDDYYWTFKTTSAPPMLAIEPRNQPVCKGDRFSLKIMAKHVTQMHKFSFKLIYNPETLEVEKVDRASFASWRPRPKFIEAVDICDKPVVDNLTGFVAISCDSTMAGGVSGSGEIVTINFHAIGAGEALLEFDEVSVVNFNGKPISVELNAPEMQVMEFHPMDVNHDGVVNILDFVAVASGEDGNVQPAPCLIETGLGQNFPNPFNPETWIPYQLAQSSPVTIRFYRSTGELVRTLDLGVKEAGFYTNRMKAAYWDGTDDTGQGVSSGVYFYTIQANGFTATRKMLLCR